MRVAAGVILIIAAIFNLVASLGYMAGGAATTGVSNMADSAYVQNQNMTDEEKPRWMKNWQSSETKWVLQA